MVMVSFDIMSTTMLRYVKYVVGTYRHETEDHSNSPGACECACETMEVNPCPPTVTIFTDNIFWRMLAGTKKVCLIGKPW
jgi:hypothetical protein